MLTAWRYDYSLHALPLKERTSFGVLNLFYILHFSQIPMVNRRQKMPAGTSFRPRRVILYFFSAERIPFDRDLQNQNLFSSVKVPENGLVYRIKRNPARHFPLFLHVPLYPFHHSS